MRLHGQESVSDGAAQLLDVHTDPLGVLDLDLRLLSAAAKSRPATALRDAGTPPAARANDDDTAARHRDRRSNVLGRLARGLRLRAASDAAGAELDERVEAADAAAQLGPRPRRMRRRATRGGSGSSAGQDGGGRRSTEAGNGGEVYQLLTSHEAFDPAAFLQRVHGDTPMAALQSGADHLRQSLDVRQSQLRELVGSYLPAYVQCSATLHDVHQHFAEDAQHGASGLGPSAAVQAGSGRTVDWARRALEAAHVTATALLDPLLDPEPVCARLCTRTYTRQPAFALTVMLAVSAATGAAPPACAAAHFALAASRDGHVGCADACSGRCGAAQGAPCWLGLVLLALANVAAERVRAGSGLAFAAAAGA